MFQSMTTLTILKSLVGSRAHGLASASSDSDYRGVFVEPTVSLLRVGSSPPRRVTKIERDPSTSSAVVDDVAWEVGHFLHIALKCNPTALEVLAAPTFEARAYGQELRSLLPYLWNPKGVCNAFIGYGLSQRAKLLSGRERKPGKYACAYLRTLACAHELLTTGVLPVDMRSHETFETLRRFKNWNDDPASAPAQQLTKHEVLFTCDYWTKRVEAAAAVCRREPDLERVNEFLLRVRRGEWE
jgi:uncharacterized protein